MIYYEVTVEDETYLLEDKKAVKTFILNALKHLLNTVIKQENYHLINWDKLPLTVERVDKYEEFANGFCMGIFIEKDPISISSLFGC